MNKERRAKIEKALSTVQEVAAIIRAAADEERAYYENMPENMQSSDRGQNASSDADKLEEWANSLDEMDPSELDH